MPTTSWTGRTTGSNPWDSAINWSLGAVPSSASQVVIAASGTYTIFVAESDPAYTIRSLKVSGAGNHVVTDNGILTVVGATTLAGNNRLDVAASGTANLSNLTLSGSATVSDEGTLNVSGVLTGTAGSVDVVGGTLFADTLAGSNSYLLLFGGSLEVAGGVSNTSAISFADTQSEMLGLDQTAPTFGAAITGFAAGDSIDLASLSFLSSFTTNYSGTTLTIEDGATPVFTFTNINNPGTVTLSDDGSGGTLIACFARGTEILTEQGGIVVEALTVGDRVLSAAGEARSIKWIGRRRYKASYLAAYPDLTPVLIRAHAFAENQPCRDLRLSPDHAVLVDDVLIPARLLVNGASVRRERNPGAVTYYHVELETHDILLSENLPTESYLDTGNRGMFENASVPLILRPDFNEGQHLRVAGSCRRFVDAPAAVEPIWQRLAQRAVMLGHSLPEQPASTTDPELRVVVDGRAVKPVCLRAGRYAFVLPATAASVHLVSRSARPCDRRPWVEDHRKLGVMVSRLEVKREGLAEVIPLDHPQLAQGWWGLERDDTTYWRWTNGDAVIPLHGEGMVVLEVTLGQTLDYPLALRAAA